MSNIFYIKYLTHNKWRRYRWLAVTGLALLVEVVSVATCLHSLKVANPSKAESCVMHFTENIVIGDDPFVCQVSNVFSNVFDGILREGHTEIVESIISRPDDNRTGIRPVGHRRVVTSPREFRGWIKRNFNVFRWRLSAIFLNKSKDIMPRIQRGYGGARIRDNNLSLKQLNIAYRHVGPKLFVAGIYRKIETSDGVAKSYNKKKTDTGLYPISNGPLWRVVPTLCFALLGFVVGFPDGRYKAKISIPFGLATAVLGLWFVWVL